MLFDTWAGLLGPEDVRTFALAYARRVFAAVRESAQGIGARVPLIYYAGDAGGWIEGCTDIGADVVGVDWRMGLDTARARVGSQVALQGNLDPTILLGPRTLIRERARGVLRAARGITGAETEGPPGAAVGHIFNLGHGILPQTPPEHARLLVDTVREYSEVPS
jgi:uroporphyrinogen decarboxylase